MTKEENEDIEVANNQGAKILAEFGISTKNNADKINEITNSLKQKAKIRLDSLQRHLGEEMAEKTMRPCLDIIGLLEKWECEGVSQDDPVRVDFFGMLTSLLFYWMINPFAASEVHAFTIKQTKTIGQTGLLDRLMSGLATVEEVKNFYKEGGNEKIS